MKTLLSLTIFLTFSLFASSDDQFTEKWNDYLTTVPAKEELQEHCRPEILEAKTNVPFKGTVIAIHGFTACPQQYFESAQLLTARGYRVVLPLLPGHGKILKDGKDDPDGIPSPKDSIKTYTVMATKLNALMQVTTDEKIIIGLSVGATVSLLATELDPTLYDRSLALSPYLEFSKLAGTIPLRILKKVSGPNFLSAIGLGNKVISWGEGCTGRERQGGRNGLCNFRLKHIAGVETLSKKVVKDFHLIKTHTQIVGVERDITIDNKTNIKFFKKLSQSKTSTALCLYPAPANHSLLSLFDSPDENKFWLESILANLVSFVDDGERFQEGSDSKEKVPLCI